MTAVHEELMRLALAEAERAGRMGDVAVGAVIVRDGDIVARGRNTERSRLDPTAHAETVALREAGGSLASLDLEGCTLYTTFEPCPMCCGAVMASGVPMLVIGARHEVGGRWGAYTVEQLLNLAGRWNSLTSCATCSQTTAWRSGESGRHATKEDAVPRSELNLERLLAPLAALLPSNREYLEHLQLAADDHRLVRVASNESSVPPSPLVREALGRAYETAHVYPPPAPPLRRRLAERHHVDPAGVLVGAGATEPIDAVLRCFVGPGDEVVVPAPSWPVLTRRLAAIGADLREVRLRVADRSYRYDADELIGAITPRTKLVVVCTPNNPTGNVLPSAEIRRIAEAGAVVLVDNAYADFAAEDDAMALVREVANVFVARTFSKAYSLAGLRIGYVVGPPEAADYVERFAVPGFSVSSTALAAAEAALDDERYYQENVRGIVVERGRLTDALRQVGFRAFESEANFVPVGCGGIQGGAHRLAAAYLERGVLIRVMSEDLARITVGREATNDAVIRATETVAETVFGPGGLGQV